MSDPSALLALMDARARVVVTPRFYGVTRKDVEDSPSGYSGYLLGEVGGFLKCLSHRPRWSRTADAASCLYARTVIACNPDMKSDAVLPFMQWCSDTKLRAPKNLAKGSWHDMTSAQVMRRVLDETAELIAAIANAQNSSEIVYEAADVCHFASMGADNDRTPNERCYCGRSIDPETHVCAAWS